MKVIRIIRLFAICYVLFAMLGCDAFVRKFTRKKKTQEVSPQEMVLVPEEYKGPQMSKEEIYRQYFLFWKSWHNELIETLSSHQTNYKKRLSCIEETIKNLAQLKAMLNSEKQSKLAGYLQQLEDLKKSLTLDVYGANLSQHQRVAEQIKRNILRDFSYHKIKKDLV